MGYDDTRHTVKRRAAARRLNNMLSPSASVTTINGHTLSSMRRAMKTIADESALPAKRLMLFVWLCELEVKFARKVFVGANGDTVTPPTTFTLTVTPDVLEAAVKEARTLCGQHLVLAQDRVFVTDGERRVSLVASEQALSSKED